jgi:GNAT superfamily N-acetyltransferase
MMDESDTGVAFDHAALDAAERRFWRDIWESMPPDRATEHGVTAMGFGPILAMAVVDLPEVPMLNLVLGATEPGAVEAGHLAAAIEWVESHGVSYYVPIAPGVGAASTAEDWLKQAGFERGYGWMKFVRGVTRPELDAPSGIEVVELTAGEGDDFARIVATGFGLPPWAADMFRDLPGREGWRCYTAVVDGTPQASAAMLTDGGIAEFGLAATLAPARGRGCQTALLRRRILDAAADGCHLLFVETGEQLPDRPSASYRNILRAGFAEAYLRPNWQRLTHG